MRNAEVEPHYGGPAWAPNQVAINLLCAAEEGAVESVAVITRGADGQLEVDWSHPLGVAVLCEMARYFQLAVDEELLAEPSDDSEASRSS